MTSRLAPDSAIACHRRAAACPSRTTCNSRPNCGSRAEHSVAWHPHAVPSICGSGSVWLGIEQAQLGSIGRLEHASPPVEVCAANRVAVPGWLRVPCLDAPPEFVGRCIEVVQFDVDAKATSCGSHLVTFAPRPESEIDDDAQAKAQDL
jgi:hypothetical protein